MNYKSFVGVYFPLVNFWHLFEYQSSLSIYIVFLLYLHASLHQLVSRDRHTLLAMPPRQHRNLDVHAAENTNTRRLDLLQQQLGDVQNQLGEVQTQLAQLLPFLRNHAPGPNPALVNDSSSDDEVTSRWIIHLHQSRLEIFACKYNHGRAVSKWIYLSSMAPWIPMNF